MSKEGSITPRTVRLTSPLFSAEYLDKQKQELEAEKKIIEALSNEKEILINDTKDKISKFFKKKSKDDSVTLEKIIKSKQQKIQQKIVDKEVEFNLLILSNHQDLNLDPWFIKFYQPSVNPNELLMELGKNIIPNPFIPLIPYFGINPQNSELLNKPANRTELYRTELHSLEKYVFEEAIRYLETQCAADEYFKIREEDKLVLPNNIALVSFFRDMMEFCV